MEEQHTIAVPCLEAWQDHIPVLLEHSRGRSIWCIHGDLGAGKTSMVTALMAYLGSKDIVSSPTYAIVNHYETPMEGMRTIYHLDLYRMNALEEVINLGWEDLEASADLMLIEWPEIGMPLVDPARAFHLKLSSDGSGRKVVLL